MDDFIVYYVNPKTDRIGSLQTSLFIPCYTSCVLSNHVNVCLYSNSVIVCCLFWMCCVLCGGINIIHHIIRMAYCVCPYLIHYVYLLL